MFSPGESASVVCAADRLTLIGRRRRSRVAHRVGAEPVPGRVVQREAHRFTPYVDKHDPADAGKNVYYPLRWQNTKGEPGPWSDVITVKIPA